MDKKSMRKSILNIRNSLNIELRDKEDKGIFNNLINSRIYKKADKIFVYVSFGSEVDTKAIIDDALKMGKKVFIPKTIKEKKEMIAVQINSLRGLIVDEYGILEPSVVDKDKISNKFDLIIMPGVAFDKEGNRIGYGGGYYDKYINTFCQDTTKAALCYKSQIVDKINAEEHDIKVNYVILADEIKKIKKTT